MLVSAVQQKMNQEVSQSKVFLLNIVYSMRVDNRATCYGKQTMAGYIGMIKIFPMSSWTKPSKIVTNSTSQRNSTKIILSNTKYHLATTIQLAHRASIIARTTNMTKFAFGPNGVNGTTLQSLSFILKSILFGPFTKNIANFIRIGALKKEKQATEKAMVPKILIEY